MDKLKVFESFVSVATRGSLSAAARAEGVAPAIIGRRLDALESHLGVKLLLRTTRRISLTHEGSAFLENCQRLLSDVANAEDSVSAGGLKASGHLLATHALQSASNGVLVRVRNQRLVTTDGPFVETKEQLGGYFLIEAHDFNEALRIASQWPSARLGTIEIRPIEETLREDSRYGDPS